MLPEHLITRIITQFGGRLAGSEAERGAQMWLRDHLTGFCDETMLHPFTAPLGAKFGALKLFCALFYLNLGLYWLSVPAAAVLGLINGVVFLGHFVTYRDWLDPFFPRQASLNVVGRLQPAGPARGVILLAGHMDSVQEFQWWYRLGHWGAVLSVVAGFVIALQGVYYAGVWWSGAAPAGSAAWGWGILLLLAPVTITYWAMHGGPVVDGAIDNLSGVATAAGVVEHFARARQQGNGLQHTRLEVISFGSEEPGLKGSRAYVTDFGARLRAEGACLINLDSVRTAGQFYIASSEPNTLVRYPPDLVRQLQAAFAACGTPAVIAPITLGASDAARFGMRRLPAVCLFGLDPGRLDPTYHTRRDCLDNLDPRSLDQLQTVLIHFITAQDQAYCLVKDNLID